MLVNILKLLKKLYYKIAFKVHIDGLQSSIEAGLSPARHVRALIQDGRGFCFLVGEKQSADWILGVWLVVDH